MPNKETTSNVKESTKGEQSASIAERTSGSRTRLTSWFVKNKRACATSNRGKREQERKNYETCIMTSSRETAEQTEPKLRDSLQYQQQQQAKHDSTRGSNGKESSSPDSQQHTRATTPHKDLRVSSPTLDTTVTITTEVSSSSSSSSSNVSLADSSIATTEDEDCASSLVQERKEQQTGPIEKVTQQSSPTAAPTKQPTTTTDTAVTITSTTASSLATVSSTFSTVSSTSATTSLPWKPRSLKDLVRRDLTSTDTKVVITALQQITLDCWDCPTQRSAVARAGGVLAVIQTMERHGSDATVQVAACQALQQLVDDSTDNQHAVADLGGLDAILAALMTHFEDKAVQEAAWAALRFCTAGTASQQRLTLDTAAPGAGLQVLLHAVEQHAPHSAVVAGHALSTVSNLCVASAERTHQLVRANGLVLLAQTLQQHHYEHYEKCEKDNEGEGEDEEDDREAVANMAHALERLCGAIRERHQSPQQPYKKNGL
eukprot:scaffold40678_cov191-Amphora_coffeaeformis.AAC.1